MFAASPASSRSSSSWAWFVSWNSSTSDEAVALAQPREDRRVLAQQRERAVDLVAEVDEPGLGQQPLVRLVEGRELDVRLGRVALLLVRGRAASRASAHVAVLRGRDVLVLRAADERRQSAARWRVGSPSGRKRSSGSSNSRSRRKITCSGCERTRNCGSSPASSADSRSTRSPKAWNVEIVVSA